MDKRGLSTGANLLRLSSLGISFALCTFVGLLLGWGLKKLFHLGDWVMLAGLFLGVVSSYTLLIEGLKESRRDAKKPPSP
jgi:F0F1-type ATP synthase assembly protein I